MADVIKPPADIKPVKGDLKSDILAKIKSKSLKTEAVIGKAHALDASKLDGVDYTLGGELHCRWFINKPERLMVARHKGYYLPEEIDSRFKNKTIGNLILMVRTREAQLDHQRKLEQANQRWDGSVMKNHDKASRHFEEFDVIKPN